VPHTQISAGSEEEFAAQAIALLKQLIVQAVARHGSCTIGLSGGSTPKPAYEALGKEYLDWSKVALFLVDERYCDPKSEESNQRLVRETLLKGASIPDQNCFFPDTTLPIEECMERYAQDLHVMIKNYLPDIVVLGMGEDGHIASLFPPIGEEALGDRHMVVRTTTDRFAVHDRISVTLNLIAASQHVIVLMRGEEKKRVWEEMLESTEGEERWPMKRVLETGEVTVITDWD